MKKALLFMTVLLASTGAFAQKATQIDRPVISKNVSEFRVMNHERAERVQAAKGQYKAAPRKTAADGVYYARPAGTWWLSGTTSAGQSWTYHVVPPFTDMTYINVSDEPAKSVWTMGTSDLSKYVTGDKNDLKYSFDKIDLGYVGYAPTLTIGNLSYGIADGTFTLDSVPQVVYPFNYTECPRYYGYSSGESAFQSGNDVFDWDDDGKDETFKIAGFLQFFEKPAAPTLFYDVFIWAHTPNRKFDPSPVKLHFYKVERDEEGYRVIGDLIKTLDLSSYEFDYDDPITLQGGGVEYPGDLVFSAEEEDEFGTPTATPFLVDTEYCIIMDVSGFDSTDLRLYFTNQGGYKEEMATRATPTYLMCESLTGEDLGNLSYYQNTAASSYCYNLAYMFDVLVDAIDVVDGTNEVTAPIEGGETTSGTEDGTTYVYTNLPFFETLEDGETEWADNYDFEGIPEWLSVKVDPTYYEYETKEGSIRGLHLVWFEAEALPSDIKGREATIDVVSTRFGFKAERSIHVVQGTVSPDAIENVAANSTSTKAVTYNLAGQKVGKGFKGLMVKDGKKLIVK